MSAALLQKISSHFALHGLLDGLNIKYYRWQDSDLSGAADFAVFSMSGTSGIGDSVVKRPDIQILVVGKAANVITTNDKADRIYESIAGLDNPDGVLKMEPISVVQGPYYLDNGRCVFEITMRCFVEVI